MAVVGFEPTPPERLEPKSSALDHSATLPQEAAFCCGKNYAVVDNEIHACY